MSTHSQSHTPSSTDSLRASTPTPSHPHPHPHPPTPTQDPLEFSSLNHVLSSFSRYLSSSLSANNRRRRDFFSLPSYQRKLLNEHDVGFKKLLDDVDWGIRMNADLVEEWTGMGREGWGEVVMGDDDNDGEDRDPIQGGNEHGHSQQQRQGSETMMDVDAIDGAGSSKSNPTTVTNKKPSKNEVTEGDMDKVRSTLRLFARDWSDVGKPERIQTYLPILKALENHFENVPRSQRSQIQVLVPGAGLGRLAWDVASLGFSCQGNEFSLFMLIPSNWILNSGLPQNSRSLYPYVHSFSNLSTSEEVLKLIDFPDVRTVDMGWFLTDRRGGHENRNRRRKGRGGLLEKEGIKADENNEYDDRTHRRNVERSAPESGLMDDTQPSWEDDSQKGVKVEAVATTTTRNSSNLSEPETTRAISPPPPPQSQSEDGQRNSNPPSNTSPAPSSSPAPAPTVGKRVTTTRTRSPGLIIRQNKEEEERERTGGSSSTSSSSTPGLSFPSTNTNTNVVIDNHDDNGDSNTHTNITEVYKGESSTEDSETEELIISKEVESYDDVGSGLESSVDDRDNRDDGTGGDDNGGNGDNDNNDGTENIEVIRPIRPDGMGDGQDGNGERKEKEDQEQQQRARTGSVPFPVTSSEEEEEDNGGDESATSMTTATEERNEMTGDDDGARAETGAGAGACDDDGNGDVNEDPDGDEAGADDEVDDGASGEDGTGDETSNPTPMLQPVECAEDLFDLPRPIGWEKRSWREDEKGEGDGDGEGEGMRFYGPGEFSMAAGEFVEVYGKGGEDGRWNAVLTCFFLDTAQNVIEYLETIKRILTDDGVWINIGPSLWHYENSFEPGTRSIELPMEMIKNMARKLGFIIENESEIKTTYIGNGDSLLQNVYRAQFWTARKSNSQNLM